ncbi:MAG: hypothetical protein GF349_03935 [Candidatus Magasanikbacteria bacterium]|nr:hypothetical protein [Candidatus Magasanikbacteria bacterium]
MGDTPWILIAVAVLILILAVVAILINKDKKRPPDYYTFFIIGLTWIAIGLPLKNYALWIMGLVFTAIGLINKDKWKQNHKKWNQLTDKEKKAKMVLITILGILVLAGFVAYLVVAI